MSTPPHEPSPHPRGFLIEEEEPLGTFSVNQLVAYNLMRIRRSKGWTQQETAEKLTRLSQRKWTAATLSAAERSWQTGRSRQFDANELVAFSIAFSCPIPYFFVPLEQTGVDYTLIKQEDGTDIPTVSMEELIDAAVPLRYPSTFIDQVNGIRKLTGFVWYPMARVERWDADEEAYYEYVADQGDSEQSEPANTPVQDRASVAREAESKLTNEEVMALIGNHAEEIANELVKSLAYRGLELTRDSKKVDPDDPSF